MSFENPTVTTTENQGDATPEQRRKEVEYQILTNETSRLANEVLVEVIGLDNIATSDEQAKAEIEKIKTRLLDLAHALKNTADKHGSQ
jgi:hypothetical protein